MQMVLTEESSVGLLNTRAFEEEWQKRFGSYAQQHAAEHLVSGWLEHGLWRRVARFEAGSYWIPGS